MATGKFSPGDLVAKELRGKPNMENYEKGRGCSYFRMLLGEPFQNARAFGAKTLNDSIKDGEPNPSTEIHLLMDEFEALSKPQLI